MIILVLSAVGVLVPGHRLLAPPRSVAADLAPASVAAVPTPSASPPAAPSVRPPVTRSPSVRVPPSPPVRVIAPAVGLDLAVRPTGVTAAGAMALPDRPTIMGWYRFGPAPGARQGAVVLGGHVDSEQYGTGPLVRLAQLRSGDRVQVITASRTLVSYEVVAAQRIAKRALDPEVIFDRTGAPVLRLITCGGRYDPERGYHDNVVITAVPR